MTDRRDSRQPRCTSLARAHGVSPPILSVANQKGGVGKTAVTLGLASAVARHCKDPGCPGGHRTLVIDLDPQANSTRALGVDPDDCQITISYLLAKGRPGEITAVIRPTNWPGVYVVPSELDVAKAENDGGLDVPFRLREAMQADSGQDLLADYDVVLIDCPPSVGRLLSAAMAASSHALLVTDAASDGLRGVANVLDTISIVRRHINPALSVVGIIVNRYRKSGEMEYREAELREQYRDLVLPGRITERTALAAAHGSNRSIHSEASEGARLLAARFDELYQDILWRIRTPVTSGV